MSYVVMIRRPGTKIPYAEFAAVAKGDPEFEVVEARDSATPSFLWKPSAKAPRPAVFHYWDGEIAVETPTNDALKKMAGFAAALRATVYGEEGEPMDPGAIA